MSSKDQGTPGLRLGPTHSINLPVDTKNGAVRITTQLPPPLATKTENKPATAGAGGKGSLASSPGKGEYASLKVKQFRFGPQNQPHIKYLYASRENSVRSGD